MKVSPFLFVVVHKSFIIITAIFWLTNTYLIPCLAIKFLVMKNFFNNELVGIIGIVLTLIFGVLSLILYNKSKRSKKPRYQMTSFNLMNSELKEIKGLDINYNGNKITNLTATKFIFWNEGKETINKTDIPENAPLKITSRENIRIYSATIVSMSDPSNQVHIDYDFNLHNSVNDTYIITYDYLDKNQKGEIKLLHSGTSDNDLIITGIVKGAGNFKNVNTSKSNVLINSSVFLVSGVVSGLMMYILFKITGNNIIIGFYISIIIIALTFVYFLIKPILKSKYLIVKIRK